jgi:type IV secretory pathway TrbL component
MLTGVCRTADMHTAAPTKADTAAPTKASATGAGTKVSARSGAEHQSWAFGLAGSFVLVTGHIFLGLQSWIGE